MFVNNANGQRGLVCQYDVVCFDEVSGISFDQKDGINIMKGYMESGEFSRGQESIRGFGGMVMVGNFDVDVEHQQRIGHLLGPLPREMRDDTAFMDRIHAYIPGWSVPKVNRDQLTDHFGLVSDFLSSCWNHLRSQSRVNKLQGRIIGGLNIGGSIEPIYSAVSIIELAADKGAQTIFMPVSACKKPFLIALSRCSSSASSQTAAISLSVVNSSFSIFSRSFFAKPYKNTTRSPER